MSGNSRRVQREKPASRENVLIRLVDGLWRGTERSRLGTPRLLQREWLRIGAKILPKMNSVRVIVILVNGLPVRRKRNVA